MLIFSTLFYIPKILFHAKDLSLSKALIDILGGVSYWFTAALTVAQVVMLTLLLLRWRRKWYMWLATLVISLVGSILSYKVSCTNPECYFPWFYKTGLVYTLIMTLGGIYHRYETWFDRNKVVVIILSALIYLSNVVLSFFGTRVSMIGLSGKVDLLGIVVIIAASILVIYVAKLLLFNRLMSFIGKNSIIFYFLSGALPAFYGKVVNLIPLPVSYLSVVIVMLFSLFTATLMSWFILKYIPWMVDLRRLFSKFEK